MKIAVYSTKNYDYKYLSKVNEKFGFKIKYFDCLLTSHTAYMAARYNAVCLFVNDHGSKEVLEKLASLGIKIVALRCSGFNNIDLVSAQALGIQVVHVPDYSPEAVAEHAVGMMMCLNRKIHRAYQRTRDANFSLAGFIGFNMYQRTAGIIGTGNIGIATIRILRGFGMHLIAYDPYPNPLALKLGITYVDLKTLFNTSDIISLHCPVTSENYHLLNDTAFNQMKDGVMIINTSRGSLIDSQAALKALKIKKIGALGMDVYENECNLFFEDKSNEIIQDDVFQQLSSCYNVLFTGHQAFLTEEALMHISKITFNNLQLLFNGKECINIIKVY